MFPVLVPITSCIVSGASNGLSPKFLYQQSLELLKVRTVPDSSTSKLNWGKLIDAGNVTDTSIPWNPVELMPNTLPR